MFRYSVTKDDFTEMTVHIMKQKSAKLSSKIKLVLFTIVQMGIVAWLITLKNDASTTLRVLMGIASVIWAVQTVMSYGCYRMRAKMMLTRQKDQDPNGDFWKEHRLQLKDGKVEIGYGNAKASLECAEITGTQETGNLTLLMNGGNIFEIVPKSVSERSDFKAFLNEVRETAARKLKEAQEKQRSKVMDSALFLEHLQIPEDEMVRQQVRMKRLSFLTSAGWSMVTLLVLLIPLAILAFTVYTGNLLYILLAVVFFFLTNAGTLMIFTPLYKNVVKRQLQPAGEGGYILAVTDKKAHWFTREYRFSYDLKNLRRVIDKEDASYFYFPDQEMLFVPASCREAFKKATFKRRSLTEITQKQKPEEEITEVKTKE
ncbi:MAG: hypothetical protein IJK77_03865 [Lachnospiraceae bacterium]|nr:hypothetical protein [Lachnospiraceae bacterium]